MGTSKNRLDNLCFGAKIRKICIPLHAPVFFYIKVGCKGVNIARACFPDVMLFLLSHCFNSTLNSSDAG